MNKTKLLRLDTNGRRQYITREMKNLSIQELRSYASQYGIRGVSWMDKDALLDAIIDGLQVWAEAEVLQ